MMQACKRAALSITDLYRASRIYRYTTIISLVFIVLSFALPAWKIYPLRDMHPYIPLHYNIYLGPDRFGPWYHTFIPGVLGFTLLIINILFQAVFFRREHVLSLFFAIATVVAELILFVATVLTVLLNL